MCDTFVALKEVTANGSVLLAKNADTEINEAQHVLKLPRRDYPDGTLLRFNRAGADGRLVSVHITFPQQAQAKRREPLEISAALGGDVR